MSDLFSDDIEIIDDSALQAIESAYFNGTALPPRTVVSKPGLVQRDLFGAAIPKPVAGPSRTTSAPKPNAQGGNGAQAETRAKVRLSKTWDPATFARHGWSKKNAAAAKAKAKGKGGKGKQRVYASDEDAWDEDDEVLDDDSGDDGDNEFLIDTSYDPTAPILPIKWLPDEQAAQTFVYPVQADKPLRAYQLNIVQRALFDNTLVSLPTGLGKTFIAAVVMLNFYRWYPKGKVLFLAPTRPLVTQQIKACHYIAGIPQADCVELTGGTMPKLRSVGWLTKRVIYSTPQTVERDLAKGRLDPRDVTCIVVDEAHRASGDYSYCGVIRYMMSRNPHFRILALTATPGARGEAVQEVIDNLHIGRVEVRAEDSIDIRQYIHKKSFDLRVLPLGPHLSALRDKWVALMKPYHTQLLGASLIWMKDTTMLSPFVVQLANKKIRTLPGGSRAHGKHFPAIKTLAAMARALEYLTIESVTSFESVVKDLQASAPKGLTESAAFREILRETSALRSRDGYVGHPKMEMLRSICYEHFKSSINLVDEYGEKRETRVMIFCNFRAVVEEIVACLNTQRPLIKATAFVGQASSKGVKGKSQKEQLETIKRFKKGHYNVLVATSIGEEGLDIGEIDLIICYESNKSPIRMLQRVGRTGRARDGHITVLMTEGREEKSWDQANDAYNDVQNALTSNKIFDLYVDGERLLPDHIKPKCEQVEIKAQPLDLDNMTMNGQTRLERKALAEKKAKRKVDLHANAPDDAFLGFRTAGQIAAAKKAKPLPPSQVLRDRKAAALLTVEEEADLRSRWQYDATGRPIRPHRFDDLEALPFDRRLPGGAQRIPRHGTRFDDLIASLKAIDAVSDDKPTALDAWHDKYSAAFDPKLVQLFRAEDRVGSPPRHRRLKRYAREESDEEATGSFPFLTNVPARTSPASAVAPQPLFRTSSKADVDPLADELFGDLEAASAANSSPRRSSPAKSPSPVRQQLSSPVHVITSPQSPLQPLGVNSRPPSRAASVIPAAAAPPPPKAPPAKIDAFDISDDFDVDLVMSDSELLAGAVIYKADKSASPAPVPKAASGTMAATIVLDDSDDGADAVQPPPAAPPPNPANVEAPPPAPPAEAVAPLPPATTEEDEYSMFSLEDFGDDEFEACIAAAEKSAAARRRANEERMNSMPPPPPPVRPTPRKSPVPTVARQTPAAAKPFRPAGSAAAAFGVTASSSPARPKQSMTAACTAISETNGHNPTPAAAPMRRLAVPDSSEASSPVVAPGPRRLLKSVGRAADLAPRAESQTASDPTQPVRPLNRLKRGGAAAAAGKKKRKKEEVVVVADSEEELNGSGGIVLDGYGQGMSAAAGPRPQKRLADEDKPPKANKRKKLLLTHKEAARFGIFDIEAVNSEASGSEASSEDYASENSIDRDFVARHEDDPDHEGDEEAAAAAASAQAQFYRDSLATQAPPGFGTPTAFGNFGGRGGRRWMDRVGQGRRPIPVTPGSAGEAADEQEDWSYDSFVVRDDEEIVYDSSSPARVQEKKKKKAKANR